MNIDAISIGKNPPHEINVVIEVPIGGEPIKYEMDKEAGILVVDRYKAYQAIDEVKSGLIVLAFCWAHTIRTQSTNRPGAWLLLGSASLPVARSRGLLRATA